MRVKKYNGILIFLLMINFSSCSSASLNHNNTKLFLVTFESKDLGDVRFYLELNLKDNKIVGGSLQKAYASNFGFIDKVKVGLFAGIKNKRVISIEGHYKENTNGVTDFQTALFSPFGNYYFNGTIENNLIEGELVTKSNIYTGKISGLFCEKVNQKNLSDYTQISKSLCYSFETNFFDPKFIRTSKYQNFKQKITKYSSTAVDDLHFTLSVFYYMRQLPYSHIGIWRSENDKENIQPDDEIIKYEKNGTIGILTISSFTAAEGLTSQIFHEILADNLQNLVIDLRNNPGGNIGPAIELAQFLIQKPTNGGYFLSRKYYENERNRNIDSCYVFSKGNLEQFMETIDKHKCINIEIHPNQNTFKGTVYILINSKTASTCEPIVYILGQESNIILVGQKTAGKMLSSKEFSLMDNFVLFAPIANYLTPDDNYLDQTGVEPEIKIKRGEGALQYTLTRLINK